MEAFIIYSVKVAICMLIFYGFFLVFLRKDTLFRVHRIYLLSTLGFSLIVPFIKINGINQARPELLQIMMETVEVTQNLSNQVKETTMASDILYWIYLAVASALFAWLITGIGRSRSMAGNSDAIRKKGYTINVLDAPLNPFSFFNLIFIPKSLTCEMKLKEILEHEKVHVKQWHSMDNLVIDLFVILFWFNPMVWIYRTLVKETHEYLADEGVLSAGINPLEYKQLLVERAVENEFLRPVNSFNKIRIKNRLVMMNKLKTRKLAALKLVAVIPIVMLMMNSFTNPVTNGPDSTLSGSPALLDLSIPDIPIKDTAYFKVDEMPVFTKGGDEGIRKYLAESIKYPERCRKEGIQGKIYVSFVINKEGAVEEVELMKAKTYIVKQKSLENKDSDKAISEEQLKIPTNAPELIEESLRVVKALPPFTPGKQDNKTVRVKMVIPINFRLDN